MTYRPEMIVVALLLAVGAASCDGDDGDSDTDGDADVDGDVDSDVDGDVDGDVDSDVDGDADGDADAELDGSVDADQRGDADLDSPVGTCTEVEGTCTSEIFEMCATGTEPIDPDPHRDCGAGWCCVTAPASPCSEGLLGHCFAVAECTDVDRCWMPVDDPSLTCEEGRVCCRHVCD